MGQDRDGLATPYVRDLPPKPAWMGSGMASHEGTGNTQRERIQGAGPWEDRVWLRPLFQASKPCR